MSLPITATEANQAQPSFSTALAQEPAVVLSTFVRPNRFKTTVSFIAQMYLFWVVVLMVAPATISICVSNANMIGVPFLLVSLLLCLPALPFLPAFDRMFASDPPWLKLSKSGIEFATKSVTVRLARNLLKKHGPIESWQELKSVSLKNTESGDVICLRFGERDIELVWKQLDDVTKQDLFLVLSRYAGASVISPEITYLQTQTLSGLEACPSSYTQMWFREYESKFELSNRDALRPGALIGQRFRVIIPLSMRGPVSTYLACAPSGNRVVLKEISICATDEDDSIKQKMIEHFDREAAILSRLDHNQIVRITDHFIENHRNYIVTEFLAGSDLRQFVSAHGPMSELDAINVAKQLAGIVQYLHLQSPPVVHRDVSPDNIMFDSQSGKITLLDFGAANVFITRATGTLIGKQSYMPPEQFRGKFETASDTYGFGATLYFLLTGKDPTPMAGFSAIEQVAVTSQFKALIKSTGASEPEARPSWSEILATLAVCKATGERELSSQCNERT